MRLQTLYNGLKTKQKTKNHMTKLDAAEVNKKMKNLWAFLRPGIQGQMEIM